MRTLTGTARCWVTGDIAAVARNWQEAEGVEHRREDERDILKHSVCGRGSSTDAVCLVLIPEDGEPLPDVEALIAGLKEALALLQQHAHGGFVLCPVCRVPTGDEHADGCRYDALCQLVGVEP